MEPFLSEEHKVFRQAARDFAEKEVMPLAEEAEALGRVPPGLWKKLGEAGLLGLTHPEEFGGTGGDSLAVALLSEELGAASAGIATSVLVSAYMAAPHLSRFGTPEQKDRWLRGVLAGEKIAAIAVTEPEAGSDVAAVRTTARRGETGWVLRGSKIFTTNGSSAHVVVVLARTGEQRYGGLSTFLVEKGDPGFHVSRVLPKVGLRSSDTALLSFEDVPLGRDRLLGAEGEGFRHVMIGFQLERICIAAVAVGVARAALDSAVAYARQRHQFGQPISRHQAIRFALAEAACEIEAARLLTWRAAALEDAGHGSREAVAAAKLHACEAVKAVVDRCLGVFGGYGYMEEYPIARLFRDARAFAITGGTPEVQKELVARGLGLD